MRVLRSPKMWRAHETDAAAGADRTLHAARADVSEAARVNNGGAFPFADARTDRSEEGSDDGTLMSPCDGMVVGSLD
jgi:hypothetical protein